MLLPAMHISRRAVPLLFLVSLLLPLARPAAALESATKPKPKPTAVRASPAPLPGADQDPLVAPLGVDAGILVDATNGKVLWQTNDTTPRAPASLTKIMTALVVLRHASLGAQSVITPDAATVGGSETYAPAGTTMTVQDMLWNVLLVSGNDAAMALAHSTSPDGTVAGFADMMNRDAAGYGATASHFDNPHGLDQAGHVSTARDLALLTLVAMKDPTFAQMVGTVRHTVSWGGTDHLLINHNRLLTLFPGTIGVKTGYTDNSGNALVSEVNRNGTTLLAVVLGAKSPAGYNDSKALYTWGFAHLAALETSSSDTITPQMPQIQNVVQPQVKADTAGSAAPVTLREVAVAASSPSPQSSAAGAATLPLLVLLCASVGIWWCLAASRRARLRASRTT